MKKTFVITMFGSSFDWMPQFIDHVQRLSQYGWEWKIFTPNTDVQTKGNVEIIPMTCEQFCDLCEKKVGVRPNLFITPKGVPSVHVTDFYVASGLIFEDYLKGSDYWGITNMDVVYGRLDHFIPDSVLANCDVMSDDTLTFNGVFSLLKNTENVNNLFREIPNWKEGFTLPPCEKCMGNGTHHSLIGTDEYGMTELLKIKAYSGAIKYAQPQWYPMHSHDRLEQHTERVLEDGEMKYRLKPNLEIKEDGSLWELYRDIQPPHWQHAHPVLGREIGYFHFNVTKKWPKCLLSTEKTVS